MAKQRAAEDNLINGRDAGAVHMAGGPHGDNDGADVPGHSQFVAGVHLQRQRGGGGPCAQSGQRGRQDVFKEVFHTPGAGGDKGVKTEENEKVKLFLLNLFL